MIPEYQFTDDYRTLKQAADEKGSSYDALRMWCRLHNVPMMRVGQSIVVRMRDLVTYVPQGTRQVLSTR